MHSRNSCSPTHPGYDAALASSLARRARCSQRRWLPSPTWFEVELTSLDQLDRVRQQGGGSAEETERWMHAFSEVLLAPPGVEILRMDAT